MAARKETLRVKGYREFLRACSRAEKATNKETRAALAKVAEPVRAEAARLFSSIHERSANSYRVRVRATGISVEQSLRKTTGQHPEFGRLQMNTALIPALEDNADEIEHGAEKAVDEIQRIFER